MMEKIFEDENDNKSFVELINCGWLVSSSGKEIQMLESSVAILSREDFQLGVPASIGSKCQRKYLVQQKCSSSSVRVIQMLEASLAMLSREDSSWGVQRLSMFRVVKNNSYSRSVLLLEE